MVFMKRRSLLTGLGAGLLLSTRVRALRAAVPRDLDKNPTFTATPFQLGVASGDPASDGLVLWTRLAPDSLEEAGGMEALKPVLVG